MEVLGRDNNYLYIIGENLFQYKHWFFLVLAILETNFTIILT